MADQTPTGAPIFVVRTTRLYEDELYGKPRGVRVDQGSPVWLSLTLQSPETGGPAQVNVGGYSSAPTVDVRYREASGYSRGVFGPDDGDVPYMTPDGLSVVLPLPIEVKNRPGVYDAQARVVDGNSIERNRTSFTVLVDRGLWTADGSVPCDVNGPPSFDEVRTAIRDHPGANRLLQEYEFDAAEIGQSIVGTVQTYNQTEPIGSRNFTTVSWPSAWRRQLIDGCLSYLFQTASTYFRRSHLPYSAGGLAIDDLKKNDEYDKASELYRDRFVKWARLTKARFSQEAGWGSVAGGVYPTGW